MIKIEWSDFKQFIDANNINPTSFEHTNDYCLYDSNGNLTFNCILNKNPSDTTDLSDFENNYLPICNLLSPQFVTPTSPRNDFQLEPEGLHCRRYNPADYLGTITLSNKNGLNYSYTKTLQADLVHEDCIWFFDNDGYFIRSYIEESTSNTLELEQEIPEGTYNLSRKFTLDYQLSNDVNFHYLWGLFFDATGSGKYDWAVTEILDPNTLEEIVRYDECWITHINKIISVRTPDGAPGQLLPFLLRIDYYYADDNFTGNIVKADYILTRKDA